MTHGAAVEATERLARWTDSVYGVHATVSGLVMPHMRAVSKDSPPH